MPDPAETNRREIEIRIRLGSITDVVTPAIIVNHFLGMPPGGAEKAVDRALGGLISDFMRHQGQGSEVGTIALFPSQGRLPTESVLFTHQQDLLGELGTMVLFPTHGRLPSDIVCVTGLGAPQRLSKEMRRQHGKERLSQTGKEALKQVGESLSALAGRFGLATFATIVHGAGAAGTPPRQAVALMLDGFLQGLQEADPEGHFRTLDIVELDETKIADLEKGVKDIAAAWQSLLTCRITLDRVPPALQASAVVRVLPREPDYYQLSVSREGRKAVYHVLGKGGRNRIFRFPLEDRLLTDFIDKFKQIVEQVSQWNADRVRQELTGVGADMARQLIPPELLTALAELSPDSYLKLNLTRKFLGVPWELLNIADQVPAALRFSFGRAINDEGQSQSFSFLGAAPSSGNLRVLIVADPAGNLPGAAAEGNRIKALLDLVPGVRADLWQRRRIQNATDLLAALRQEKYQVLHYAGHAFYDEKDPEQSGLILNAEETDLLTAQAISRQKTDLALVFINACESGTVLNWGGPYHHSAIADGLADAFLRAEAVNYIGTFWPVHDDASATFAVEFYKAIVEGASLGLALRQARQAILQNHGWAEIVWAGYTLYGDPTQRLILPTL